MILMNGQFQIRLGKPISDCSLQSYRFADQPITKEKSNSFDFMASAPSEGSSKCQTSSKNRKGYIELKNAESAIAFLQQEHSVMLHGLHQQIAALQEKCTELQFCLTLQLPYKEDKKRIQELEKALRYKEQECQELLESLAIQQEEMVAKEHLEQLLKAELNSRDKMIHQLREALTSRERRQERTCRVSSLVDLSKHPVPTPPPKPPRGVTPCGRPVSLYRRLLGLSSRSMDQECHKNVSSAPTSSIIHHSQEDIPSAVPQLPPLVPGTPNYNQRTQVRQQLRVHKQQSELEFQTLAIDQASFPEHHIQQSEQFQPQY